MAAPRSPASTPYKPAIRSTVAAVLLAVYYPTLFAISKNWYAFNAGELVSLLVGAGAFGVVLWTIYRTLYPLLARLLVGSVGVEPGTAKKRASAIVLAVVCVWSMFLLLDGTLLDVLGGKLPVRVAFILTLIGVGWLFVRGRIAAYNAVLAAISIAALAEFATSFWSYKAPTATNVPQIAVQDFEVARFITKPNIYFFIYDSYGSSDAYAHNFNFGNSKHYSELERRGFRVAHTLSNYTNTWNTTLGIFLGRHHYYRLSWGNEDTKIGRELLAGRAHNPVLTTLRRNGYRLQLVNASDYFLTERGTLDFLYPDTQPHRVLKIFGSRRVDKLAFNKTDSPASFAAQKNALSQRLAVMAADKGQQPWFTFFWVPLPSHASNRMPMSGVAAFQRRFVERTKTANAHMVDVMDRIIEVDPSGVIVIIGDHGAKSYSGVSAIGEDPNRAFTDAGIDVDTATLDHFGIMIAVRSGDRCNKLVYPGISPVNIMRVIFACLSNDADLLARKADDISIVRRHRLWLAGREGKHLPRWETFEPPK